MSNCQPAPVRIADAPLVQRGLSTFSIPFIIRLELETIRKINLDNTIPNSVIFDTSLPMPVLPQEQEV
jgi:hypothetical protein